MTPMIFEATLDNLRDAIAYEFFMNNANSCLEESRKNNGDVLKELTKLAKASYAVAEIFIYVKAERDSLYPDNQLEEDAESN